MTHPYSTIEFGESLHHIGEPLYVPEWGTTVLRRKFEVGYEDAIGTYPITVFKPDTDFAGGFDRLRSLGLISVVLVIGPNLSPELSELREEFDIMRPLRVHYLHDRSIRGTCYSKHHRYEVRRAARVVAVEQFELGARLEEWGDLYQALVARHNLQGTVHAFSRRHHEVLARLPGIAAIGALVHGRLVSCHVWVCHEGHAMSHLAATSEQGYELGAAYAVNAGSIDLLANCRTMNFGGGVGATDNVSSGLARFKQGFANLTAHSYLCGKILIADAYNELARLAGVSTDASYFPAYRQQFSPGGKRL